MHHLTIGAAIRARRLERGLSLRDLAERAGTDAAALSRLERDRVGITLGGPKGATIEALARALGWRVSELVAAAE